MLRSGLASLAWACVLLSAGRALGPGDPGPGDPRPNILLIMADDLGFGDLGCYGNDTLRTPNIDRLAREGVRLTQHLAAASMCSPSRAAFLTGRYPIRSGMTSNNSHRVVETLGASCGLPVNETTFAALAKEQGYSTAIIGKWHQGLNCQTRTDHCHHPDRFGFDYFYGMPFSLFSPCWPDPSRDTELAAGARAWLCVQLVAVAALSLALGRLGRWVRVPWALVAAMGLFVVLLGYFWFSSYRSGLYWDCILMRGHAVTEQPMKAQRAGSIMLREATSFMESHREGPFLLFFSFLHVHVPLPTTEDFIGTSRHGLYGDQVQEMDFMLGRLLDAIDTYGLRNRTLVYFTSDHGGHLEARLGHVQLGGWNGVYKGGKGMGGWEGGFHVPGLFRWPGKLPPGQLIEEPTSHMDILPTIAALTGASLPQDRAIDGWDIMPLLQGSAQHSGHEFLFHYCGVYLHAARWDPKDGRAVWKVHYVTPVFQPPGAQACYLNPTSYCECSGPLVTHHDPPLLFDLSRDPSEATPLTPSTEPQYHEVLSTVDEAVRRHRQSLEPVEPVLGSDGNTDHVWLKPCCGVFPFCLCDKEGATPGLGF